MDEQITLLYKIFLQDGAGLTFLKGIQVTFEISFLSLLGGTLLGALICFWRMGSLKIMRLFAMGYIAIVRGSPVLMLLMLLFYGLLAQSNLEAVTVAVIAFSLHTAAYVAELLRVAITSADYGQVEAARTLGFSKYQTFRLITLPQLIRMIRPVYQSTIVNLIQWTSVVGYITITDLTRIIYNTAARTMQPMVTIVGGMFIYIAMSYCVYGIFALWEWYEQKAGEVK